MAGAKTTVLTRWNDGIMECWSDGKNKITPSLNFFQSLRTSGGGRTIVDDDGVDIDDGAG